MNSVQPITSARICEHFFYDIAWQLTRLRTLTHPAGLLTSFKILYWNYLFHFLQELTVLLFYSFQFTNDSSRTYFTFFNSFDILFTSPKNYSDNWNYVFLIFPSFMNTQHWNYLLHFDKYLSLYLLPSRIIETIVTEPDDLSLYPSPLFSGLCQVIY